MNERLIQFLSAENISQAQFADSINVARAGVSHIVAGRNKPSWDFIINTMNRYPTLNIEWLLTGKGKMYKGSSLDGADEATSQQSPKQSPISQPDENTLFGDYGYTCTGKYGGYETELAELDAMIHHLPRSSGAKTTQRPFITISEAIEEKSAEQPATQPSAQPVQYPAPQPSAQPVQHSAPQPTPQPTTQPASLPYTPPQNAPQTIVKKPNVAKIIVFFDDGTFQECK